MVVKTESFRFPARRSWGNVLYDRAQRRQPGGCGGAMGGRVTFVAHVGNDIFGSQAIEHFQRKHHTSFVTTILTIPPEWR